jgi:hypothetical protein
MANPFGPFYSFETLVMIVCAVAYYKAAEIENRSGILCAGISVLFFLSTWLWFGWGYLGDLLGQATLLGGITIFRAVSDSRKSP